VTHLGTVARVTIAPAGLTAVCALIASVTGRDPMFVMEVAALTLTGAWLAHVGRRLWQAVAEGRRLSAASMPAEIAGTEVRLLHTSSPVVFVSGLFRPQIYLSPSLIEVLDRRELRGVLLHEQHHRRTLAPLRGIALEGWLRPLCWLPPARRALVARMAALEVDADAAAVARGVAPATLASALLKCEPGLAGATSAFSAAAEIRIGELVGRATGQRVNRHPSVPLEWAAPASAGFALWICHLIGY
jgi:hypothetical protein